MISRRNIRIKVMQALYANELSRPSKDGTINTDNSILISKETVLQIQSTKKLLHDKIERSSALFNLLLSYLCEVTHYVNIEAKHRAGKYLATPEDKNVNTKLANNLIIQSLWENEVFQEVRESQNINQYIRENWVKKFFRALASSPIYITYLEEEGQNKASDKSIIKFLWNDIILLNEDFLNDLTDEWPNWEDDSDMIKVLVINYLNKASSIKFRHFISEEKNDYAGSLVKAVIDKNDYLLKIVQTKLKNWEAERIALVDLVLLKMGLSEFLYFPTIPVKVTINEYIDIAKGYSTEQSGQFINGILDNLRKDLMNENKIRKIDHSK